VQTEPSGAQVYLQRRGDVEVEVRVGGTYGKVGMESFTEDFYSLGTSPIEYEFDLSDEKGAVHTPDVGGAVKRHHKEGTVRIELDGYQAVEQKVRFTGDPIELVITLQTAKDE
jgi:hypothetical protein